MKVHTKEELAELVKVDTAKELTEPAKVHTTKELAKALKTGELVIEVIDPKTARVVLRIHATGSASWAIAIGAIGVAVVAVLSLPATVPTTGGAISALAFTPSVAVAGGVLGFDTAVAAVAIAVAGGGMGILNKLRGYKVSKSGDRVVLTKRKSNHKNKG